MFHKNIQNQRYNTPTVTIALISFTYSTRNHLYNFKNIITQAQFNKNNSQNCIPVHSYDAILADVISISSERGDSSHRATLLFRGRLTVAFGVPVATCSLENDTGIRRLVATEDYRYAATEATARASARDARPPPKIVEPSRTSTKNKLHIAKTGT
jgi:hypothetical protein